MKRLAPIAILSLILVAGVAMAADSDRDGLDDAIAAPAPAPTLDAGEIAVVDTGSGTVANFVDRLTGLGYTVVTIPMNSGVDVLLEYSLVILPTSHASNDSYANFDGLADDYHTYVSSGGGLWISQPNPFDRPGGQDVITWAPYALTVASAYTLDDCPPVIVDATHCITEGLPDTQFSFPADQVVDMGPEWQVLVEGPATGSPGILVAEYGEGKVLVELAHPSGSASCPIDDAAFDRYASCTMAGTVATENATWGDVKALYR